MVISTVASREERTSFLVEGSKCVGSLFLPTRGLPAPGVVFFHGRATRKNRYVVHAGAVSRCGLVTFAFDFRGCGESEGDVNSLTLGDGLQDAVSGFDFVASLAEVTSDRMGICGSSFGGYLALLVACRRPVPSLVLRVPAVYRDEWLAEPYGAIDKNREAVSVFRSSGEILQTRSFDAVAQFTGSLLIVAAGRDQEVPRNVTDAYYRTATRAQRREIVYIEDADHRLSSPEWDTRFQQLAMDWFATTLSR